MSSTGFPPLPTREHAILSHWGHQSPRGPVLAKQTLLLVGQLSLLSLPRDWVVTQDSTDDQAWHSPKVMSVEMMGSLGIWNIL